MRLQALTFQKPSFTKRARACPSISGDSGSSTSLAALLPRLKRRPRARLHVPQQRLLPRVFRMVLQKIFSQKVSATRVPSTSDETHIRGHFAVGGFALHGTARVVRI